MIRELFERILDEVTQPDNSAFWANLHQKVVKSAGEEIVNGMKDVDCVAEAHVSPDGRIVFLHLNQKNLENNYVDRMKVLTDKDSKTVYDLLQRLKKEYVTLAFDFDYDEQHGNTGMVKILDRNKNDGELLSN